MHVHVFVSVSRYATYGCTSTGHSSVQSAVSRDPDRCDTADETMDETELTPPRATRDETRHSSEKRALGRSLQHVAPRTFLDILTFSPAQRERHRQTEKPAEARPWARHVTLDCLADKSVRSAYYCTSRSPLTPPPCPFRPLASSSCPVCPFSSPRAAGSVAGVALAPPAPPATPSIATPTRQVRPA
jgi:hypothetical protein